MMSFETAASIQYRYGSYYTVFLVYPDNSRVMIGYTARKTGAGLLAIMRKEKTQDLLKSLFSDGVLVKKFKDRLEFTNGFKIVFGGTIRQEAAAKSDAFKTLTGYSE